MLRTRCAAFAPEPEGEIRRVPKIWLHFPAEPAYLNHFPIRFSGSAMPSANPPPTTGPKLGKFHSNGYLIVPDEGFKVKIGYTDNGYWSIQNSIGATYRVPDGLRQPKEIVDWVRKAYRSGAISSVYPLNQPEGDSPLSPPNIQVLGALPNVQRLIAEAFQPQVAIPNRFAPTYSPDKWNKTPESANCYIYAINDYNPGYKRSQTPMEPGTRLDKTLLGSARYNGYSTSPDEFAKFVKFVIGGAISDGLRWTGQSRKAAPNNYKIALFASPATGGGSDASYMGFHWMRQDSNGYWSHKPGALKVSNKDDQGQPIIRPDLADMGRYKFIGYFDAPREGLKLHKRRFEGGRELW